MSPARGADDTIAGLSAELSDAVSTLERTLPGKPALAVPALEPAVATVSGIVRRIEAACSRPETISDEARFDAGARTAASLARARLRGIVGEWRAVRGLCLSQATPPVRPLLPVAAEPHGAEHRERSLNDMSMRRLHGLASGRPQDAAADRAGLFADIPLPHSIFVTHVIAARRVLLAQQGDRRDAFLDVGCGCGLKLVTASPCFSRVAGLEYDPGYAAVARDLLGRAAIANGAVIEGDGRTFGGYADFDVVYLYRPMKDDAELAALERAIVSGVRRHALLVAPYDHFGRHHGRLGCARIAGHLYLARGTGAEADRLRGLAERIGTAVKPPATPRRGEWAGVLEKLGHCGYAPPDDPPRTT